MSPSHTERLRRTIAGVVLALVALPVISAEPAAAAGPTVVLEGRGWGHGRGMGQWGAFGYARDRGWNHAEILGHFYGGTSMGSTSPSTLVRVRLAANRTGAIGDLGEITVTSGVPFTVGSLQNIHPWRGVTIRRNADGTWSALVSEACGGPVVWETPIQNGPVFPIGVTNPGDDSAQMITICNAGGTGENRTYRGTIDQIFADGALHTVNTVTVEQYLRSVVPREMPASWHPEALRSQAVAARSYGLSEHRWAWADTCSTDACQVYYGFAGNAGSFQVFEDSRTNAAIEGTAGAVRRTAGGVIARTEFSSSTGGWTAGGAFPPVIDEGDATAGNSRHAWTTSLDAATIGARYGIGSVLGIDILTRNGLGDFGGRVLSMRVRGTGGNVTRTGNQFRADFGLFSDWFTIATPLPYLDWHLRYDNAAGPPGASLTYGATGNRPLLSDWDGGGTETVGVFDRGWWHLRNSDTPGSPNLSFAYGGPEDLPVTGDWDGLPGADGIGVYSNGTFYLRNTPSAGPFNVAVPFGAAGYQPVVGDWDGNGTETIGVYFGGVFYLRNSNTPGPPDLTIAYGGPGYVPVVGDWDGSGGADTIGVYVNGNWYLRTVNIPGPPTISFSYGAPGYLPVVGDHNGDTRDTAGIVIAP